MAHSEKLLDIIALGKYEVSYTKANIAFALYTYNIKQETPGARLIEPKGHSLIKQIDVH